MAPLDFVFTILGLPEDFTFFAWFIGPGHLCHPAPIYMEIDAENIKWWSAKITRAWPHTPIFDFIKMNLDIVLSWKVHPSHSSSGFCHVPQQI